MLREPFGEFAGGGGLSGTLQADNNPHGRRPRGKKRFSVLAEKCGEFIANDLDDLLIGRKLQHHFAAKRFAADGGKKLFNNRESDIAFEHGFADFAKRGTEMLVGEFALAAQILEGALQFLCKVLKHGGGSWSSDLRLAAGFLCAVTNSF